ncbi:MAG: PD-(D/E)XK nuclease family protein, partial [Desulfuromonadaceae bacterium]|nr:PD-(D/E)XK nuclease family protein [Desulfuromonadaceae bacterium]
LKPCLLGSEWRVERSHLEAEILAAALRWREILRKLDARVVGVEVPLEGNLDGVPLSGIADLLLALPQGRLLVVDYKKSRAKKRRIRMEKGFDHQTSLYRVMLQTGGVSSRIAPGVGQALKEAGEIGQMYYLMDDQLALANTSGWIQAPVYGIEEMPGDVSAEAMALIRQRLAEVRAGRIQLNRVDDPERLDKIGMKLYALEDLPLLSLFLHPKEEEES